MYDAQENYWWVKDGSGHLLTASFEHMDAVDLMALFCHAGILGTQANYLSLTGGFLIDYCV